MWKNGRGKRFLTLLLAACALTGLAACGEPGEAVAVQSVKTLCQNGSLGLRDQYAGVVVSGSTQGIPWDGSRTVGEILVEVGQEVTPGDVLFTYDDQALALTVEQIRLEIEQMKKTVADSRDQIAQLEKERASASQDLKLQYTLEIQELETGIRETEYNQEAKERELESQEALLENAQVSSEIAGRVKEINETESTDEYGNPKPFMTIVETGNLRIRGAINELNYGGALSEGAPVTIRSRREDHITWSGTIESIDWENPLENNSGVTTWDGNASDDATTSSRYPFYVALEQYDGLFIGQHVYIEPGTASTLQGEGLRLPAYLICDVEGEPYVWAAEGNRLVKRGVTLGGYDEEQQLYLVTEGLAEEDWIAFPEEGLTEGLPVFQYDPETAPQEPLEEEVDGQQPAVGEDAVGLPEDVPVEG